MGKSRLPGTRFRTAALWCAVLLAGGAVSAILLWPSPVDRPVYGDVLKVLAWLKDRGLPAWVGYNDVERLANVALFVVPGLAASLLLARRRWWLALVLCIGFSAVMELTQLFLPARSASADDVLLNGIGALIGVGIGAALRGLAAAARQGSRTRA